MPDQAKIGLDNQAFRGRLRQLPRSVAPAPTVRPASVPSNLLPETTGDRVKEHLDAFRTNIGGNTAWSNDGGPAAMTMALAGVESQPQPSIVARQSRQSQLLTKGQIMLHVGLFSMAAIVFIWGVTVSLQTSHTNSAAAAQMQAILQQLEDQPAAK